jgi:hypothetical protein
MSELVARKQTGICTPVAVEITEHMYGACMWGPDTKRGTDRNQVRTHRGAWMNVIE